jgi:hypothetical protein
VLAGLRKAFELDLPGTTLMIETARLKASTPIALGDCFAITTACARNLTLLTGDPEILDRDLPCQVEDLRKYSDVTFHSCWGSFRLHPL